MKIKKQKTSLFSIRQVTIDDARAIVELLNPIIEAGRYTIMDEPIVLEEQINFIRGFPGRGIFQAAICEISRSLLGIQDIMPAEGKAFRHVGEISTFVSLAAREKGIGRSLSQATFRLAEERGYRKIKATIRADNPGAVFFYQSQGFRTIGTAYRHALVRDKYVDEILMEKWLPAAVSGTNQKI